MRADLLSSCLVGATFEALVLVDPSSPCPTPIVWAALAVHVAGLLVALLPSALLPVGVLR